jgi:predicted porin
MKKTQFALAALALVASTAAMAESTISGTIDAGVASTTTVNNFTGVKTGTYFSGAGGFVAGNNLIFSGSEEIDGGVKATYTLGMGFDAADGTPGNGGGALGFTQQANVGLAGDFGSVKLGMQLSPFIASMAGTMLGNGHFFVNRLLSIGGGSNDFLINGGTAAATQSVGGFFVNNAISYTTPSIGGFSATALMTPKSGSNGSIVALAPTASDQYSAFTLNGSLGDVAVTAAYHKRENTFTGMGTGATYKMGPMTLAGNYMSVDYDAAASSMANTKVNSFGFGVGYDVSEKINLALQYARNDLDAAKQALTGVHAKYSLSKRTFTYASYTNGTNGAASSYEHRAFATNATLGGNTDNNRTVAVGVAHSF